MSNAIVQTDVTKTRENGKTEYMVWAKRREGAWYVCGVYETKSKAHTIADRLTA